MADDQGEKIFYHAAAVALMSNYRALKKLRETHGTWEATWAHIDPGLRRGIDPEKAWKSLEPQHIRLILLENDEYPAALREISWSPFGIFVRGTMPDTAARRVAIVGTRKATESGRETAYRFGSELARAGCAVVSGLALGIDAASHAGCLDGGGMTIAVLGNGVDQLYPRTNEKIGEKILRTGGAIISEYPPGAPPLPAHFLERNRIVSGLSEAVVVIEMPKESGAQATARFAVEQNRDVFVVPGPANHPNFYGSHQLIRNGAELVTAPADVLEAMGISPSSAAENRSAETKEERIVLTALKTSAQPLDIDKLIELTHLETHVINSTVSFLVVKNLVVENGEGYTIM